jgi:hypothetical protein
MTGRAPFRSYPGPVTGKNSHRRKEVDKKDLAYVRCVDKMERS